MRWCTKRLTYLCFGNVYSQMYNEGISLYFSSGWNTLDISVVGVCMISSGYALTFGAGAQPWTQFACMICWLEVFNMLRGELSACSTLSAGRIEQQPGFIQVLLLGARLIYTDIIVSSNIALQRMLGLGSLFGCTSTSQMTSSTSYTCKSSCA